VLIIYVMVDDNKDFEIEVMPDRFEGVLSLDNGSAKAEIALGDAHWTLTRLVGEDTANKLLWEVTKFKKEVDKMRLEGVALGSTDLQPAVDSLYYDSGGNMKDPKTFGLDTERELRLAAHVVSSFVKEV